ncbi:MAG: universal stress protein [Ottowia sp.]|uniref:universal stress protein n=1 Tax=unclassified Ottowia TaxID=2645081 RepID=UPI003C2E5350
MQTPNSILLHLDGSARIGERIKLACRVAESFDAEVTAKPCTYSALMRYPFAIDAGSEAIEVMRKVDQEARDKMHGIFLANSAGSARLHWEEADVEGPWGFGRRALYADLLILGQRDKNDAADAELPTDFLPSVLAQSGRPALVMPYAGPVEPLGRNILLAWKETRESARAVTAALPWLSRATQVHAVAYGEDAQASLQSLRSYLQKQGIRDLSLHRGDRDDDDVGNKLLSLASDLGSDLLVMGCYGHSRAREWILGGATLSILQSMTLPVLMSH